MSQAIGKIVLPKWLNHQTIGLLSVLLILAGMLSSPAAMSIGMIGLTVNAVFNKNVASLWRTFWGNRALLGLTGVFAIYAVSGFYSENTDFLLDRLRMKLPFLLLPFAVLSIPRFDTKLYYQLLYVFFWLVTAGCLYSLALFAQNPAEIIERYKQGQVLPTPVMHIRFSLMVAFCVGIGWQLFRERFYARYTWEPYLTLAVAIFLSAYLHFLAVRSGLVALYAVLFFLLLREIILQKRYWLGGISITALIVIGWLALWNIPTLYNKLGYMRWSLELFQKGVNLEELSDSHRLGSILAGIDLSRQYFWTGVGVGDLRQMCDAYFTKHFPGLAGNELMPHNQYIFVFAATGVLGFLYFIWATTYPLFYRRSFRWPLTVAFHLIVWSSFLTEHTIETQLGTAFYITFVLLSIRLASETAEKPPV